MNVVWYLKMTIRIVGLILLAMGYFLWRGEYFGLIHPHMTLGFILTFAFFGLIYYAFRAGVALPVLIVAALVGIGLPIWGWTQETIISPERFWLAQYIHAAWGIITIGLAEMLGGQIRRKSAPASNA